MIGKKKTPEQIEAEFQAALRQKQEYDNEVQAEKNRIQKIKDTNEANKKRYARECQQYLVNQNLSQRLVAFIKAWQGNPSEFDQYAKLFGLSKFFAEIDAKDTEKKITTEGVN